MKENLTAGHDQGRAFGFIIGSFWASKSYHYVFSVIKAKTNSPADLVVIKR